MKRATSQALIAGLVAMALVLAGCSGQQDYSKATACKVPTELVSKVLGSEAFSSDENSDELPIDGNRADGGAGQYQCRILDGDQIIFSVRIGVESESTIGLIQSKVAESPNRFTTEGDGQGKVDAPEGDDKDLYAQWICGDVGMTLEGETKEQASVKDITALMKAWAEKAGCWSQEKFPADSSTS